MRLFIAALLLWLACCFGAPANAEASEVMSGMASVDDGKPTKYDASNYHGKVATGTRFNPRILAVAHCTLTFGALVMVAYRDRMVIAAVNDRGPCCTPRCRRTAPSRVRHRVIDMTPAVAKALGFPGHGLVSFWLV